MAAALTLTACRTALGTHEEYRVEHTARRPGGDVDAVVSVTPYDHSGRRTYLPFRRSEGLWRPLAGLAHVLDEAIAMAARSPRFAGWDSAELAAVLATMDTAGGQA